MLRKQTDNTQDNKSYELQPLVRLKPATLYSPGRVLYHLSWLYGADYMELNSRISYSEHPI